MRVKHVAGRAASVLLALALLLLLSAPALAEGTEDGEELLTLRYSGFVYPGEYETEIPFSERYFLQELDCKSKIPFAELNSRLDHFCKSKFRE